MTEEQRVKLEELIFSFEQVVLLAEATAINGKWPDAVGREYALSEVEKARDRITKHLDKIQWSAATYNLRRGGTSVFMDVDNKDEDNAGCDLPKYLVESPIEEMSKVGKNLDEEDMYEAGFIPVIGHLDDFPVVTSKEEKEEEKEEQSN